MRGEIAPSAPDWIDLGEWLARRGDLCRHAPGPGEAYLLAKAYLDRWRQFSGDQRVLAAIRRAKRARDGKGWFGDYLIKRLERLLGD